MVAAWFVAASAAAVVGFIGIARGNQHIGGHKLAPSTIQPLPTAYQLQAGVGVTIESTTAQPPVSLTTAEQMVAGATGEAPTSGALYNCEKQVDTPPIDTTCWVIGLPIPSTISVGTFGSSQTQVTATYSAALVDAETDQLLLVITGTEPPSPSTSRVASVARGH